MSTIFPFSLRMALFVSEIILRIPNMRNTHKTEIIIKLDIS